jgi:hypothetical protein
MTNLDHYHGGTNIIIIIITTTINFTTIELK